MRMVDIIAKKRDGNALAPAEIAFVVNGYTEGTVPDYQMSAFLMAVYLRGMSSQETAVLTQNMAYSGDIINLRSIPGIKVDKHSTGGVGDKTTLVVAPLAAACGVKVAKMSGRGLGHTGGTVDKLEAIPGFQTTLDSGAFVRQVSRIGLALVGQSGNLAPADKKIYALRDVTATVNSIPLIASSIMSKKMAAGADAILLDVKYGSGALVKNPDEALALAREMIAIGRGAGMTMAALMSDMGRPLGFAVGNALEVVEAVHTLCGEGPPDLEHVCLVLAANMLALAGQGDEAACLKAARHALDSGAGLAKLREVVAAQGGDTDVIDRSESLKIAPLRREVMAQADGALAAMDAEQVGVASMLLGAGRRTKEDAIDHGAGLVLRAKPGDQVKAGQSLATLYTSSEALFAPAEEVFRAALQFTSAPAPQGPLVLARVDERGTVYY